MSYTMKLPQTVINDIYMIELIFSINCVSTHRIKGPPSVVEPERDILL